MAERPFANLPLARCPHCNIASPLISQRTSVNIASHMHGIERKWSLWGCTTCAGAVMSEDLYGGARNLWPKADTAPDELPNPAKSYLNQAYAASLQAPTGAVMLTASAVDAMLKDKGYKDGSLNSRINKAAEDHLITLEMAAWAHEVRLDANDQRHADEGASLPTPLDAERVLAFASALVQFLYVLPARVARGRDSVKTPSEPT